MMSDEYIHIGRTNKDCEPLRGEILAAILEAGDYDDLYRRCMLAIDNPGTSNLEVLTWMPVNESVPPEGVDVMLHVKLKLGSPVIGQAYRDEGEWRWDCGARVRQEPVAWAEMPRGMR